MGVVLTFVERSEAPGLALGRFVVGPSVGRTLPATLAQEAARRALSGGWVTLAGALVSALGPEGEGRDGLAERPASGDGSPHV